MGVEFQALDFAINRRLYALKISHLRYSLLLLLFLLLPLQATHAQSGRAASNAQVSSGGAEDVSDVIRVRTDEVVVPVSVRDERGAPVNGLTEDQFLIYENGVRQEIRSFNRHRVPANIILLLDASGSVFGEMNLIREAAKSFVKNLSDGDHVSIMQFADRVEVLEDWVAANDLKRIQKALDWRYHGGERTTFYEGLYRAATDQLSKVEGRRIIILLTDGIDTAQRSVASFADALGAVRGAEASVYVVSLTASLREELNSRVGGRFRAFLGGVSPSELSRYRAMIDEAEKHLIEIAEATGGRIFFPREMEDLIPAYAAISEELRTQYILTYVPKKSLSEGEWRGLKVLVIPGGYEVAARAGFRVRR